MNTETRNQEPVKGTKNGLAANECRRRIAYQFTNQERIDRAIALGQALNTYCRIEEEKKRVAKEYDGRLDITQAEIDQLNVAVTSGYELREYVCFWEFDRPTAGRKTLRKREGGEVVCEEGMTEADRQMILEIIDAQAANTDNVVAFEPITLPAYDMPQAPGDVVIEEEYAQSFDFSPEDCAIFADLYAEIFTTDGELHDEDLRAVAIAKIAESECAHSFARWLAEPMRKVAPGAAYVLDFLETHFRGAKIKAEAEAAKAAAQKKEAKKGRRATAGTVEVAADEGTRDDAGSEGKNDL